MWRTEKKNQTTDDFNKDGNKPTLKPESNQGQSHKSIRIINNKPVFMLSGCFQLCHVNLSQHFSLDPSESQSIRRDQHGEITAVDSLCGYVTRSTTPGGGSDREEEEARGAQHPEGGPTERRRRHEEHSEKCKMFRRWCRAGGPTMSSY